MGGVRTDLRGQTSLPGLYAAGEVACTGVHGANRLASNSLLEGLVYGARAAQNMREHLRSHRHNPVVAGAENTAASTNGQAAQIEAFIKKVQSLMWQYVGVVRDGKGLRQVVSELSELQKQLPASGERRGHEAANILQAGLLIARSALAREESRGAHYRLDFPLKNDAKFLKHSVVSGDKIRFE
jgi:L-aspartate oxidase